MSVNYETDFAAWADEQGRALSERRFDGIDFKNLAEEIASLGKSQRRELKSRLRVLLMHLLKWEYQSDKRSRSWRSTIFTQRDEIVDLLEDNPSLRQEVEGLLSSVARRAADEASSETGLDFVYFVELTKDYETLEELLAAAERLSV